MSGNEPVIETIVELANCQDFDGWTPLHTAGPISFFRSFELQKNESLFMLIGQPEGNPNTRIYASDIVRFSRIFHKRMNYIQIQK